MASRAKHSAERRPGRPPAGGPDQRAELLDTALQRFSDQGIAATSLRSLAKEAGVTPAMLNYYFGSKDQLIEAVVAERLLPAIGEQRAALADLGNADGSTMIAGIVTALHAIVEKHPWFPKLWVREVLTDGGRLRNVFIERIGPEIPVPLTKQFAKAQQQGELNAALNPRLLFVSLIGLIMVPFAAAPIWQRVFSADDIGADAILEHTLALVSRGVAT